MRFSDKPVLLTGFTDDVNQISGWLHSTEPRGWTALHDAIYLAIQKRSAPKTGDVRC